MEIFMYFCMFICLPVWGCWVRIWTLVISSSVLRWQLKEEVVVALLQTPSPLQGQGVTPQKFFPLDLTTSSSAATANESCAILSRVTVATVSAGCAARNCLGMQLVLLFISRFITVVLPVLNYYKDPCNKYWDKLQFLE